MTDNINIPFGMSHTSRETLESLMTKNNFTTEAPLIFAMYLDHEYRRGPVLITTFQNDNGDLSTRQCEVPLSEILSVNPDDAYFSFETSFEGYNRYAIEEANRSDVVVINRTNNNHVAAFEIKLCVVPNSGTANRDHNNQSCEIVVRPPSIEQLAFSIADTYGEAGREELRRIIVESLGGNTQGFDWSNEIFMKDRINQILNAAKAIAINRIESQKPFAMTGIWRTQGQSGLLEENCFDVFVWTNLSFLQLLTSESPIKRNRITRPGRSLIWLIKALYDYSIQGMVDFDRAHSEITFGTQTDKAGAFAGNSTYQFLSGERLSRPLIPRSDLPRLIPNEAIALFMPERRLDATLFYADQIERARTGR